MLKLSGEGLVGGLDRAISLSDQEGRLADQRIHLARLDWEGVVACVASFEAIEKVEVEMH
jgi:hypothetical protein